MTARIAIVSTRDMPVLDADEELLLPLLPEAEMAYWDDEDTDWAAYDVVVLRSTWNYTEHLDAFLAWATRVSQVARLVNPVEIIEWNTDKRYLADLAARGIPVVPTEFVAPGDDVPPDAVSGHVVVKPSVGAGSRGAKLFDDDAAGALAHVAALHADGATAMIQPYLDGVDEHGETALIFVGGEFSHAARKAAILSNDMSWSTGLYADEKVAPATASASGTGTRAPDPRRPPGPRVRARGPAANAGRPRRPRARTDGAEPLPRARPRSARPCRRRLPGAARRLKTTASHSVGHAGEPLRWSARGVLLKFRSGHHEAHASRTGARSMWLGEGDLRSRI